MPRFECLKTQLSWLVLLFFGDAIGMILLFTRSLPKTNWSRSKLGGNMRFTIGNDSCDLTAMSFFSHHEVVGSSSKKHNISALHSLSPRKSALRQFLKEHGFDQEDPCFA